MRESRYTSVIGAVMGYPYSWVRQTLRELREAGITPGIRGGDIRLEHIPAIVLALSSPRIKDASGRIKALQALPLRSVVDMPSTAGAMLAKVVATLPATPVVGDFDCDDGLLHISDHAVVLEVLTLTGNRCCIGYGPDSAGAITKQTTIPLQKIRSLAEAISRKK
ncbi:MAG: hypothetical protein JWR80_1040 [Bradyrhizobium sp.]|nr:hypothetical protein [Bradyrhizobium sp.]